MKICVDLLFLSALVQEILKLCAIQYWYLYRVHKIIFILFLKVSGTIILAPIILILCKKEIKIPKYEYCNIILFVGS